MIRRGRPPRLKRPPIRRADGAAATPRQPFQSLFDGRRIMSHRHAASVPRVRTAQRNSIRVRAIVRLMSAGERPVNREISA